MEDAGDPSKERVHLSRGGLDIAVPVTASTLGPNGLLIEDFGDTFDLLAYDPTLKSTALWASKITYLDSAKGELFCRGYSIRQLAAHASYLEVAYLLLNGEMPGDQAKRAFEADIRRPTMLHEQLRNFFNGFRRDAHPMAVLCSVVGAMSAFYGDSLDVNNEAHRQLSISRILAKLPTVAAWSRKYAVGQPFVYPSNKLSFTDNFLYMLKAVPPENLDVDPDHSRALGQILIVHADHELSPSTSTVRMAGLTGANPFACIAAGLASFWGPRHGGADGAVLSMLAEIRRPERVKDYLAKRVVEQSFSSMPGVGHPLYGPRDPRAAVMRGVFERLLRAGDRFSAASVDPTVVETAVEFVETIEQTDEFVRRGLLPNVDFYTSLNLYMIGFPADMFTVVLAVARAAGWLSHWNEMATSFEPGRRARQIYIGPAPRDLFLSTREDRRSEA